MILSILDRNKYWERVRQVKETDCHCIIHRIDKWNSIAKNSSIVWIDSIVKWGVNHKGLNRKMRNRGIESRLDLSF